MKTLHKMISFFLACLIFCIQSITPVLAQEDKDVDPEEAVKAYTDFIGSGKYKDDDFITNINHENDYYALDDIDHNGIPELYIRSQTDATQMEPEGYAIIPYRYQDGEVDWDPLCFPCEDLIVSDTKEIVMSKSSYAAMDTYTLYKVVDDAVTYSFPETQTCREFYYYPSMDSWRMGMSMPPYDSGINYLEVDDSRDLSEKEYKKEIEEWMGDTHNLEWTKVDDLSGLKKDWKVSSDQSDRTDEEEAKG